MKFSKEDGIIVRIKLGNLYGAKDVKGVLQCLSELLGEGKIEEVFIATKINYKEYAYSEEYFSYEINRSLILDPSEEESNAAQTTFSIIQFADNNIQIQKEPGGVVPYKVLMEVIKKMSKDEAEDMEISK